MRWDEHALSVEGGVYRTRIVQPGSARKFLFTCSPSELLAVLAIALSVVVLLWGYTSSLLPA